MFGHVVQPFLEDAVEHDFDERRQPPFKAHGLEIHVDAGDPGAELVQVPFHGGDQPQIVEHIRPEVG